MRDSPGLPEPQDKVFQLLLDTEMITRDSGLKINLINQCQSIYNQGITAPWVRMTKLLFPNH